MNKIGFKKIVLTASLVLAMAFTLSCSAQDESDVVYGPSVTYEGETYKSVVIGSQTWMARNLNYNASGSRCFDDAPSNCSKYGRLYDWNTAMTACPPGWHLPSWAEWDVLVNNAGGSLYGKAYENLMAKSYGGEDKYGFAALMGGHYSNGFNFGGRGGFWWTTEELYDRAYLCSIEIGGAIRGGGCNAMSKANTLVSVRCVKD